MIDSQHSPFIFYEGVVAFFEVYIPGLPKDTQEERSV